MRPVIRINKKGITPVIATVLLLMMTVAAAAGAYFWMSSLSTQIETSTSAQVSQTLGSSGSSLSVISLICRNQTAGSATQGNITVIIQNNGVEKIKAGTWYAILRNSEGNDLETNTTSLASVDSNGFTTLNVGFDEMKNGIDSTTDYSLKFTSPVGSSGTATCTVQEGHAS